MIGADLLRFSDRVIVIADGECQRVNTMQCNLPYQWSWHKTRKGKVFERHNRFLKWPGYVMSPDAARITRFQQSWVDNGEDPRVVLADWERDALNEENLLAGQNFLCFDVPLWMLWRRALGLKPRWDVCRRVLDTHLLGRAYLKGWKPDRENLLAWLYKVADAHEGAPKTNLTALSKALGIEVDETRTHDGDYDVELTTQVLWQLIVKMEI